MSRGESDRIHRLASDDAWLSGREGGVVVFQREEMARIFAGVEMIEGKKLPWNVGFHNEIADMPSRTGDWHPDMVRYRVVQICDFDGRHVAWAKSPEHAAMIVEAVNATQRPAKYEWTGLSVVLSGPNPLRKS